MKKLLLGSNFAIFLLFFGIAVLESYRERGWWRVAFWLVIGILFLAVDALRKPELH